MTPFILQCVGCGREVWHECEVTDHMWPPAPSPWCPSCQRSFHPRGDQWHQGRRDAADLVRVIRQMAASGIARRTPS